MQSTDDYRPPSRLRKIASGTLYVCSAPVILIAILVIACIPGLAAAIGRWSMRRAAKADL